MRTWKLIGISFAISLVLAFAVIFVATDVFAFSNSVGEVTVIIPENASRSDVADALHETNLVRFPFLFELYARFRGFGEEYLSGEFSLDRAMSYDELHLSLVPRKNSRTQMKVTIPEGFTTDEIIDFFVEKGIGTREGFRELIQNGGNFGYDYLDEIPAEKGRAYRLDGYLFPDTYFVYADSTEKEILQKLLDGFDRKFDEKLRLEASTAGLSVDEAVRLASVIEGEAYFRSDMKKISSVFHNRLNSKTYPFLESDATVKYAKELMGDKTPPTGEDIKNMESPYNTYRNKGLPPGAICSPGLDAILAAVHPADTDYFYFVSAGDKTTIFSRTYEEHLAAIAACRNS